MWSFPRMDLHSFTGKSVEIIFKQSSQLRSAVTTDLCYCETQTVSFSHRSLIMIIICQFASLCPTVQYHNQARFTGNAAKPRRPSNKLISHSPFRRNSGMDPLSADLWPLPREQLPLYCLMPAGIRGHKSCQGYTGQEATHTSSTPAHTHTRSLMDERQKRQGQSERFPAFFFPDVHQTQRNPSTQRMCFRFLT